VGNVASKCRNGTMGGGFKKKHQKKLGKSSLNDRSPAPGSPWPTWKRRWGRAATKKEKKHWADVLVRGAAAELSINGRNGRGGTAPNKRSAGGYRKRGILIPKGAPIKQGKQMGKTETSLKVM